MLQAVIHQKSSRWLKEMNREISSTTNTSRERIPREDEITSTVFGMLQYFDSREVYAFFCKLIKKDMETDIHDISHLFSFWESKTHKWKQIANKDKKTEPDVMVRFTLNKTEKITFILELKWGQNSHFGQDQLERQWANFQEGETHLIYLATHIHHDFLFKKDQHNHTNWHDLTWGQFLGFVLQQSYDTTSYSQGYTLFLYDLAGFLQQLNLRQFSRFSHFNFPTKWNENQTLLQLNKFSFPLFTLTWKHRE